MFCNVDYGLELKGKCNLLLNVMCREKRGKEKRELEFLMRFVIGISRSVPKNACIVDEPHDIICNPNSSCKPPNVE